MTMLYKVNSGIVNEVHYGLNLARVIGFPDTFLHVAKAASGQLQRQTERKKQIPQHQLTQRRSLILSLYEILRQMDSGDMDDDLMGSYLKRLQVEFAHKLDVTIETGNPAILHEEEAGESKLTDDGFEANDGSIL
jgi:DNA mismatch repair protein MSH4